MSVSKQEVQALIDELEKFISDVENQHYNEEFLSVAEEEGWYQWQAAPEAEPFDDSIPF